MRQVITDDIGQVKLGELLLPGIFESMEVYGEIRIDEKEVPGSSGKKKQPVGFEDAEITLRLRLMTDNSTCYDKMREIVSAFQAVDEQAKPYVYRIVNHVLDAWNITEVIFKGLRTVDSNSDDTLRVDLNFVEYRPVLVLAEEQAQTPELVEDESGEQPSSGYGDFRATERDSENSFAGVADFRQEERSFGKSEPSPAVDDDEVTYFGTD